jgi:hypothetical protein
MVTGSEVGGGFYCSKLIIVEPIASGLKEYKEIETVDAEHKSVTFNGLVFFYTIHDVLKIVVCFMRTTVTQRDQETRISFTEKSLQY